MIKIAIALLLGLTSQSTLALSDTPSESRNQNLHGLKAPSLSKNAPPQTIHWGQLVGNWDVMLEALAPNGTITQSYEAEWNFFYTLGGTAIQDIFILPPRKTKIPAENRFYGTGIRIFNSSTGLWESIWIDTGAKTFDFRTATSTDTSITMTNRSETPDRRWKYFNINRKSFEWTEEKFTDGKWILVQRLTAHRKR